MEPGFEIGTCYACHQGQVFIAKSEADAKWFVVCEECFTDWPDPKSFTNHLSAGFETYGRFRYVTREEIGIHPWKEFVENAADLEEP